MRPRIQRSRRARNVPDAFARAVDDIRDAAVHLDAYIEARAHDQADLLTETARADMDRRLEQLGADTGVEIRRLNDLVAELRRHLDVRDRSIERLRQSAENG